MALMNTLNAVRYNFLLTTVSYGIQTDTLYARDLQEDLNAAARWEQDWLMPFQLDKCNILNITQKQKPIQYTYKLHGHSFEKKQKKTPKNSRCHVTVKSEMG